MQPQPLQFSLARLFAIVTAACGVSAVVGWLGFERVAYLAVWTLPLMITTLPIYAFALSILTLTTSSGGLTRRRMAQGVLFLCCLPLGWLALWAVVPLLD